MKRNGYLLVEAVVAFTVFSGTAIAFYELLRIQRDMMAKAQLDLEAAIWARSTLDAITATGELAPFQAEKSAHVLFKTRFDRAEELGPNLWRLKITARHLQHKELRPVAFETFIYAVR